MRSHITSCPLSLPIPLSSSHSPPSSPSLLSHAKIIHKGQTQARQGHPSIAGRPPRSDFRQLFRGTVQHSTTIPFPSFSRSPFSPSSRFFVYSFTDVAFLSGSRTSRHLNLITTTSNPYSPSTSFVPSFRLTTPITTRHPHPTMTIGTSSPLTPTAPQIHPSSCP